MLEHPGRLFDKATPLFGGGSKDGVELTLAHDHMHFSTNTGVAQQLLHIKQPAGVAIDGVFRSAITKHRATDRDFGVFNRQCAI